MAHTLLVVALIQLTYLPTCFVFVKNEFVCVCIYNIYNKKDSRSTVDRFFDKVSHVSVELAGCLSFKLQNKIANLLKQIRLFL